MRLKNFSALVGETLAKIEGGEIFNNEVVFTLATGEKYKLYHSQDCCEEVNLEDVIGEWAELIGYPILWAEEAQNGVQGGGNSETWTFYRIGCVNGNVVMRWVGTSNGYYSESVDWWEVKG